MGMEHVFAEAHEAGKIAAEKAQVVPMVVREAGLFGEVVGGQEWFVEGGVCGFAGIKLPGRGAHVKMAKAFGARKGYPSGLYIPVHQYGQSMQRKEAYAEAFAKVLQEVGIQAYAESRMD
jgi:hypothetical protein